MVAGGNLRDPFGEPFRPFGRSRVVLRDSRQPITPKHDVSVKVARMSQERDILEEVDAKCESGDSPVSGDTDAPCKAGFNASLFPSTTFLVTADAVMAPSRVFDPKRKRFVRKALTSRIYYQVGGIHPDLNRNRVDDAIDIEFGDSEDDDEDGVPDDAKRRRR
jgi:hypothetical protein